jgi:hypothetical protein
MLYSFYSPACIQTYLLSFQVIKMEEASLADTSIAMLQSSKYHSHLEMKILLAKLEYLKAQEEFQN